MPAPDSPSRPRTDWWRSRPLRYGLAALAAVMLVLWGTRIYYKRLKPNTVNLEVAAGQKYLAETEASIRVTLTDVAVNAPVPNVPVEVELIDPASNRSSPLTQFATDAAGSGPALFRLPAWPDGGYVLRVTAKPESGPEIVEKGIQLQRSMKVMLSTDKPVYQPGQTIHLRALALRRPDLKPVAEENATISVVDPKGNVVFKTTPKTSKFGITSADFPLADELTEGAYTVSATVRGVESKLTVEVKPYVLPKFKIDISTDKPYYRPGDTVKATVKASYFFGKPVNGELLVDSRPRFAPQTLKLDDKGEARFEATLKPSLFSGNPMRPDTVDFFVKVTDTAGQEGSRTASRNVVAADLLIEAIPEGGSIVAGVKNRVYVLVSQPDGQPVKANVKIGETLLQTDRTGVAVWEATPDDRTLVPTIEVADAEKRTAKRTFTFAVGTSNRDFLMRVDKSVYAAGDTLKLTVQAGTSEPVFVDLLQGGQVIRTATVDVQSGGGELSLDLSPDWFGTLEINAYRLDVTGEVIGKRRSIFVRPARDLVLKASFESLTPPAKQLLTGGAGASATFRPGQKARVTLSVTDADGKPAPGAVSLAAVDEAVFNLLEDRPGLEKQFFLGDSSLPGPIDEFVLPVGRKGDDRRVREDAEFARTAAPLSYIASVATKKETYPTKMTETEQRRKNGLAWVTKAWQVIGFLFGLAATVGALFGMHWLAMNFVEQSSTAWRLSGVGVGMILTMIVIVTSSPEYGKTRDGSPKSGSDSETVEGPMTKSAGAKKDDGSDSLSGGSLYVRKAFPETLLWIPEKVTDDQGKVSVEFPLADSITSWRMTASAVNASGQLGGLQTDLVVFQPFFVDLNLPVKLTRGDEISVPVVVSNYEKKSQKVKIALKKADWFEQLGDPATEIDLGPGEVKSVSYRLKATKVGWQTFEVTGSSGATADAVRRVVEVVPDGRRVEQVFNGTLDKPTALQLQLPNDAIEGSPKLFVKFYPSSFSQLVEGLDAIFQMPSGCFEQTSSTTYPNLLALSYLKQMKKTVPTVEATARQYIALGYQRLLTFEVPGGGFDWYGHAPANRTLTAYGLMEFRDMAEVYSVDPKLIERTRSWLLKQRQPDGSWEPDDWSPGRRHVAPEGQLDLKKIIATAYIAWAAFTGDKADSTPTRKFLSEVPVKQINDPYVLALLANALLAVDDASSAETALTRLDELKQQSKEGDLIWWTRKPDDRTVFFGAEQSGDIETTALAVLARKQAKSGTNLKPMLLWLTKQRDPRGTWHTTQATVLTLKTLLSASQPGADGVERKIDVAVGPKFKQSVTIPADQSDVLKQVDVSSALQAGPQALNLTEATKGETNFQVVFRYHVPAPEGKDFGPFPVQFALDRQKVRVGESVTASLRTVNTNPRQDSPMVLIELPVPVGFSANAEDFNKLVADKKIERFQTQSDRVVVYLRGIKALDPFDLKYTLKATLPSKTTTSGAKVYEYYDPSRVGVSPPMGVEVTE